MLFDLLIGMIISSLVILTVFMVQQSYFQTYFGWAGIQQRQAEELTFSSRLKRDWFEAQEVIWEDGLQLRSDRQIHYQFDDAYTLRQEWNTEEGQFLTDTIHLVLRKQELSFDEELVNLVRFGTFQFAQPKEKNERTFRIVLNKHYPAVAYLK